MNIQNRPYPKQAIIDDRKTFIFTEDQLLSMLQGTIELYKLYRVASSEEPSKDMAIAGVFLDLEAEQRLADLGVIEASLQIYNAQSGRKDE